MACAIVAACPAARMADAVAGDCSSGTCSGHRFGDVRCGTSCQVRSLATVAMLATVGGCGSLAMSGSVGSVNLLPKVEQPLAARLADLFRRQGRVHVAAGDRCRSGQRGRAVRDGRRRSAPADACEPDGAAQSPGGIALQMTECDVVRRAGAPEQLADRRRRARRTRRRDHLPPRPAARHLSLRRRTADVDRARAGSAGRQGGAESASAKKAARS